MRVEVSAFFEINESERNYMCFLKITLITVKVKLILNQPDRDPKIRGKK